MTSLPTHQRTLLKLIKGRTNDCVEDLYLSAVAHSRELAVIREIAVWWRAFQIQTCCPLTSKLLQRLDMFDRTVELFFSNTATSPFVEQLSADFLQYLLNDAHPLVPELASFEFAVQRAKSGDEQERFVTWDRNPYGVLYAITNGNPLPDAEPGRTYLTRISAELPNLVECTVSEEVLSGEITAQEPRCSSSRIQ